jgi:hypothetical protein
MVACPTLGLDRASYRDRGGGHVALLEGPTHVATQSRSRSHFGDATVNLATASDHQPVPAGLLASALPHLVRLTADWTVPGSLPWRLLGGSGRVMQGRHGRNCVLNLKLVRDWNGVESNLTEGHPGPRPGFTRSVGQVHPQGLSGVVGLQLSPRFAMLLTNPIVDWQSVRCEIGPPCHQFRVHQAGSHKTSDLSGDLPQCISFSAARGMRGARGVGVGDGACHTHATP